MKNYRIIAITFLQLLLLFGCRVGDDYQPRPQDILANEITISTAQKLIKTQNLHFVGTGGAMMDNIEMLAVSFEYDQEVTQEQARQLLIVAAEEYLRAINQNEEIRPYLDQYPFTAKNVKICIYFHKPDRSQVNEGKIWAIDAMNAEVIYRIVNSEGKLIGETITETYEEALKIIAAKYPSNPSQL